MCHLSHITCQVSFVTIFFFNIFLGQRGGASQFRVCYQQGLPRLVYKQAGLHGAFLYTVLRLINLIINWLGQGSKNLVLVKMGAIWLEAM